MLYNVCTCSKFRENSYINSCVWVFCRRCLCILAILCWVVTCWLWIWFQTGSYFCVFLLGIRKKVTDPYCVLSRKIWYIFDMQWNMPDKLIVFFYLVDWSLFRGERKTDCLLFNITLYDKMFDVGYEVGSLAVRNATLKLELLCWFSFHLIFPLVF
jgi:hypothetical protein